MRLWLKWLAIGFAGLLLLPLAAAGLFVATVDGGWVGRKLSEAASAPGTRVEIGRVTGFEELRVDWIAVADAGGVWLELEGVALDWRPRALLDRLVSVDRLEVETVRLTRLPLKGESSPAPAEEPLLPQLPVAAAVRQLRLPHLSLPQGTARIEAAARVSRDWRDVGLALDLARTDAPGRATLRLDAPSGLDKLDLQLTLSEPRDGLIAGLLDLPDRPALRLALDGDGPASDWRGRLSAALEGLAKLDGPVRVQGERLNFALEGTVDGLVPPDVRPLAEGPVALEGTMRRAADDSMWLEDVRVGSALMTGTLDGQVAPALELRADLALANVKPLAGIDGAIAASARVKRQADGLALEATGRATGLAVPEIGSTDADFSLKAVAGEVVRILKAELQSKLLAVTAEGSVGERIDLALAAQLPDLSPLAGAAGKATLAGRLQGEGGTLRFAGEVAGEGLALGQPEVDRLLGGRLGGTVAVARSADGLIAVEQADLKAAHLSVAGSGSLRDGKASTRLTASLPRLSVLAPELSGALTAKLALDDRAGTLALDGALMDRPLHGGTRFALEGERLTLDELRLALGRARLEGKLAVQLDRTLADGTLRLDVPDVDTLLPGARGRVSGTLALAGRKDGQAVDAAFDAEGLSAEGVSVERAELKAKIADALGKPKGEASALVTNGRSGTLQLSRLRATAKGGIEAADFELQGQGSADRPIRADLAGTVSRLGAGLRARLRTLDARYGELAVALRRPLELRHGPDGSGFEGLQLAVAGGTLEGDGRLAPGAVSARLAAKGLRADQLRPLLPEPQLVGRLDGRIDLAGTPQAPTARLTLAAVDLGRPKDPVKFDADLSGELARDRLALAGTLGGLAAKPMAVKAELPVRLRLSPFEAGAVPGGSLAASLEGPVEIARLAAMAGKDIKATGTATVLLAAGGTLERPQPSGRVEVAQATLDDPGTGLSFRDIAARLVGGDGKLTLERLEASDGKGGKLRGSGVVEVAREEMPFEARLDLQNLSLAHDMVTGRVGGGIGLKGSRKAAEVSGTLRVDGAEVSIPDRMPLNVVKLDVVEVNGPVTDPAKKKAAEKEERAAAATPMPVRLGIGVEMPNRIFVRGRGLDSEWGGKLNVRGSAAAPDIEGQLTLLRGRLAFLGRSLDLSEGAVTFPGGVDLDPYISVTARSQTRDLTASITIGGRASKPTLELSSTPSLPQDEILARVLFGRRIDQLSATQAVQLAQGVQELTGGTGEAGGIVASIRKATGLDVIDVKSTDRGPGALSVGKYLRDNVYVSGEQGTTADSGKVRVEVELTPEISVDTAVGRSAGEVGVNWKHDY